MNHNDWLAQADIYALGALDGDELIAFEAHLAAGCPECEQHLLKTREALTLLPHALEPVAPPSSIRARVLAQIAEADVPQPVIRLPRRRWWPMGVSALAAAGLLIALSVSLYQARHELQQERGVITGLRAELEQRDGAIRAEQQEVQRLQTLVASLHTTVAEHEETLQAERRERQRATDMVAALQTELAKRVERLEAEQRELQRVERVVATLQSERDETLRLLSAPQARLVRLAGQAASPRANAHLVWNPATRAGVLLTSGLPKLPGNRIYELWAIAGNEPVSAGLFEADEAGRAFLRLPALPRGRRIDTFAVTDEPAGGVPKPTGQMHLLGSL